MNATGQVYSVGQFAAQQQRATHIQTKRGDVLGANFTVPKGDFARFLGAKEPTKEELSGNVAGWRAVEVALHKEFNKLGQATEKNGAAYRNMYVSMGKYENQPGRTGDMLKDGLDAMRESVEVGQAMGMRYLEMQYKFQNMSTNFGCISNLMKTRSESIKKAMNDIR